MKKSKIHNVYESPLAFYPLTLKVKFMDHTEFWQQPTVSNTTAATTQLVEEESEIIVKFLVDAELDDERYAYFSDDMRYTIAHECTHIKQYLAQALGTTLDSETEAYLVESLNQHIYTAYSDYCKQFVGAKK